MALPFAPLARRVRTREMQLRSWAHLMRPEILVRTRLLMALANATRIVLIGLVGMACAEMHLSLPAVLVVAALAYAPASLVRMWLADQALAAGFATMGASAPGLSVTVGNRRAQLNTASSSSYASASYANSYATPIAKPPQRAASAAALDFDDFDDDGAAPSLQRTDDDARDFDDA